MNKLIGTGFNENILTLWPCSEESINCSYLFTKNQFSEKGFLHGKQDIWL